MVEIAINDGKKFQLERGGSGILVNGSETSVGVEKISQTRYRIMTDRRIYDVELLEKTERAFELKVNGKHMTAQVSTHIDQILEQLGIENVAGGSVKEVKAPMPGTILSLAVESGMELTKGDTLLILEAMKMENVIKSPSDGKIKAVHVGQGDNVDKNQLLISFE